MFENIRTYHIFRGRKIAGVSCHIVQDDDYELSFVILEKNGKKISVKQQKEQIHEIGSLNKIIPANVPVSLSLEGKGIIHKVNELSDETDEYTLIGSIFPQANPEDFYIQKILISGNNYFVSIIRKNIIDKLLDMFKTQGYYVTNCILGPFRINAMLPFMEDPGGEIMTRSNKLGIIELRVHVLQPLPQPEHHVYAFDSEQISSSVIVPFANAFSYIILDDDIENVYEKVKNISDEFFFKKLFSLGGWTILLVFLVTLLINFLLYNNLNKKHQLLSSEYNQNKSYITLIDTLKKELQFKRELFEVTGLLTGSKVSFFCDRIALLLPASLLLEELNVNPVMKKIKSDKEITYDINIIEIKGVAKDDADFEKWLQSIREEKWISDAKILSYNQMDPKRSEFHISLQLKEE